MQESVKINVCDFGGWNFVFFIVDLEGKVSEFRDKFYKS